MMHAYKCEIDLALTYSTRRNRLARECARRALHMAHEMRRPDLAWLATELMIALAR